MASVLILSEWLSNPVGSDAEGEWVELWNSGAEVVSLLGWKLANSSGKSARLSGILQAGERKVFPRTATKLILRNEGETVTLLTPAGAIADTSAFPGLAPEGKSMNKDERGVYVAVPTPGAANEMRALTASILESGYVSGVPISPSGWDWISALLGTAVLLTAAGIIIIRAHDQNDTLPGGDQGLSG